MTVQTPRSLVAQHGAAAAVLAALALAGCGKKEEAAAPAAADSASAAVLTAAASSPAAAGQPLKVGFIYLAPVGDAGWTYAHDQGRKAIEKEFGDKISVTTVDKVPEGPDAERVFRDLAGQGNKLLFGTTFGYMEPMLKAAADLSDVRFEQATGYKTAPNMRVYDSRTYEGAYMAGVIAGGMTKTNTLGVVGSIPVPEVIRNIDAFTLGAQSVNPKIKTKVVWVNLWFDPPKETEAAQSLLNAGADVLLQNTDSPAVLQTAEKAGKYAFGWDSDMASSGPNAHLGSAVINWAPYYIKATRDALAGTWTTGSAWWGVKEGAIDFIKVSDKVPAEVKSKMESVKAGLKDGSFVIWKGPIVSSDGATLIKTGEVGDDKFLGGLSSYVKGVEGKVPGGDKK